jgi:diguanylate cyclase (GGDEF)-like protein
MLVHIVDDNDVNREIFAAVVGQLGPEIRAECFARPEAALDACRAAMPDAMLVDFMMPGMDGLELVAGVRALPGAKAVPIVMITAATDRAILRRALDVGVTDFLTKPVNTGELKARLTNLLALRRAHLQLQDRGRWLAEEVRKATERALHLANHDPLTGLPNRALFRDRLELALAQARRDGERLAVLCLDLDRFKEVNDTLGHPAGDALLQRVASGLRDASREGDTVARLGGDEFVIVQVGAGQPVGAAELAARLTALVAQEGGSGSGPDVEASIGVAVFPEDGADVDTLLTKADMALLRAKADGRGTFRFFEPAMDAKLQARRALEWELRAALRRGEFLVHYQPQADARTDGIVGFEALVRWSRPGHGLVPAGEFVPLAEECGLIRPLGEWVLRTACMEAARWPSHLRLGVNLSPLQVRADLPPLVAAVLRETGLAPGRLELEVTEGVLIKDIDNALDVLTRLKALGVAIAMDDFGTGYSSLSYLQRFPFDRIKVDRSFVAGLLDRPEAAAIVRAIITMSASLSMASTAEGVETEQQLVHLRQEACGEVQGFLIGRPMPAEAVLPFLLRRPGEHGHASPRRADLDPQLGSEELRWSA